MSEYIGSIIAVTSKKSNIRFVGTLQEIDSTSLTVTLENVRAYGTEGRAADPSQEIPPSDQVFPQIVFPGAEVADLKIISQAPKESQPPQSQHGSTSQYPQQQHSQYQQPNQYQPQYNQPPPQHGYNQHWGPPPPQNYPPYGHYPPQQSQFGPPGGGPHGFPGAPGAPGAPQGAPSFGPPPGWQQHGFPAPPPPGQAGIPQQSPQRQAPAQPKQEQQKPAGQAPPPPSASKPTDLSGTSILNAAADPRAPPLPKDSKPESSIPTEPKAARAQAHSSNPRVAVPSIAPRPAVPTGPKAAPQAQSSAPKSTQNATEAAAAAVAAAMAKLGPVSGKPNGKPAGPAASNSDVDAIAHRIGEMSTNEYRGRGGNRGVSTRGARGPRRGGAPRQPVEVPTTDFDFESSNAKFNKQDLVKQAIATGSPAGTPTDEPTAAESGLNGDSAHAAEEDVVIPGVKKYNKSSFFDDLSSELKDRQTAQDEGKRVGGPDFRSEERRRNMETFGEASPFRGRGRGRGYGGRGRGGYRRPQQDAF